MTNPNTTATRLHGHWAAVLLIASWCISAPALALEANEVRGEIVEVSPDDNRLRLEVSEAGAERGAREGRIETYEFDESTEIRMEDPSSTVLNPLTLEISDLASGTRVLLDFEEIDGRRMARGVNVEESEGGGSVAGSDSGSSTGDAESRTSDMAAMESSRGENRDSLPATASMLPLLAIFGAGFGGLALLLRLRRR